MYPVRFYVQNLTNDKKGVKVEIDIYCIICFYHNSYEFMLNAYDDGLMSFTVNIRGRSITMDISLYLNQSSQLFIEIYISHINTNRTWNIDF